MEQFHHFATEDIIVRPFAEKHSEQFIRLICQRLRLLHFGSIVLFQALETSNYLLL
jgi:hypothetical protein